MTHQLKILRKKHHLAVELRYLGKTYLEIAEEIKNQTGEFCSASGIRNWFAEGGKLLPAYFSYCEQENSARERDTRIHLRSLTQEAVGRLKKSLVDDKDKEGIRSAIYVLDKILGKTEENINLKVNDYEQLSDEELDRELARVQLAARTEEPKEAEVAPASGDQAKGGNEIPELGQEELGDKQGPAA